MDIYWWKVKKYLLVGILAKYSAYYHRLNILNSIFNLCYYVFTANLIIGESFIKEDKWVSDKKYLVP